MSKCRSCGAEILWTKILPSGKSHPVDLSDGGAASLGALIGLIALPAEPHELAFVVSQATTAAELRGTTLHKSHFATCRDSEEWRKR